MVIADLDEVTFDLEVDGSSIGGLPVAIVQMQQQQQGRRTN